MRRARPAAIAILLVLLALLVAWWFATGTPEPHAVPAPMVARGGAVEPMPAVEPDAPTVDAAPPEVSPPEDRPPAKLVRCALPAGLGEGVYQAYSVNEGQSAGTGTTSKRIAGSYEAGAAWVPKGAFAEHGHQAFVAIPGYLPGRAVFDGDGCSLDELERAAEITGKLVGPMFDADAVFVRSCGEPATVDLPNRSYAVFVPPDVDCALSVTRRDGLIQAQGEVVMAVARAGVPTVVDLPLPDEQMGGLGLRFQAEDDGLFVTRVRRDAAAHGAGLMPGDQIVAIDGQDASALTRAEAAELVSGVVGDEVTVVVQRPQGPTTLTIPIGAVPDDRVAVRTEHGVNRVRDEDAWLEE